MRQRLLLHQLLHAPEPEPTFLATETTEFIPTDVSSPMVGFARSSWR
jgi:hypothetical protein